jgi:hypothetical protein
MELPSEAQRLIDQTLGACFVGAFSPPKSGFSENYANLQVAVLGFLLTAM